MKQTKQIRVDGIQSTDKIITILMNTGETYKHGSEKQDKYKIWVNGRDGKHSLPYKQFQEIRPIAGDTLQVETYEVEKEFTNPAGEQIKYMDRVVNHFIMVDGKPATIAPDAPQSPQTAQKPQSNTNIASEHTVAQRAFIAQMVADIKELKDKVALLEKRNEESPIWINDKGKWEIVPTAFDGVPDDEINVSDLPI